MGPRESPPQKTLRPPHIAGRSPTLRVGFYLPERFRELGTTGRQDSRTPNASPPPHVAGRLPRFAGRLPRTPLLKTPRLAAHTHTLRVSSRSFPSKSISPPTLRVIFRIAGRFLPTHTLSGLRDYETTVNDWARDWLRMAGNAWERLRMTGRRANKTTGPKDDETTGLRDYKTAAPQTPRRPHTLRVSSHSFPSKSASPPPHCGSSSAHSSKNALFPLTLRDVFPPKAPTTLLYCGSLSHFAGRFLPTHTLSGAARPRDYETTGTTGRRAIG